MLATRSVAQASRMARSVAARAMSAEAFEFGVRKPFDLHLLEEGPSETVSATKEETHKLLRDMLTIRRMEISCDQEYKMRNIRGFCHLYDGQEAIAAGTEAALTRQDSWITSYRCHATALMRGETVEAVLSELFGFKEGTVMGKGGSMHFYNKESNFYGGAGIVGAQIPVGAGLGFANKYKAAPGEPMNVALAVLGDGAVNQGQVWEVTNMSALWKLPVIFMVENNQYGMGTATSRSSCNPDYYTHGNVVPGIRCDGMDVLAVRECMRFAREWCSAGKGPLYVEMVTYRYHGHSMSDPGVTYRDRDEVSSMRQNNDCIEILKANMLTAGFASEDELKAIEKEVRKEVSDAVARAKKGSPPPESELTTHVLLDHPEEVRLVERTQIVRASSV